MSAFKKGMSMLIGVPTLLILLSHTNSLPFAYTIRSWWLLKTLINRAKQFDLSIPPDLFTIVSQKQRCMWDDIDYNQHMNNSTYNKKLDFSRIHLLYVVLPKIMMEQRHQIFAHNAGVLTLFKKEIPPLQPYTIQTRIWTWNEKWLFLQHRFVQVKDSNDGNSSSNVVFCTAVSKLVFKKASGKTVPPEEIFQLCGHNFEDEKVKARKDKNWSMAQHLLYIQGDNIDWETSGNSNSNSSSSNEKSLIEEISKL